MNVYVKKSFKLMKYKMQFQKLRKLWKWWFPFSKHCNSGCSFQDPKWYRYWGFIFLTKNHIQIILDFVNDVCYLVCWYRFSIWLGCTLLFSQLFFWISSNPLRKSVKSFNNPSGVRIRLGKLLHQVKTAVWKVFLQNKNLY